MRRHLTTAEPSREAARWVTAVEACQILGVSYKRLRALGTLGHVTTRTLPGSFTEYDRQSLEAVNARSIRPARGPAA